MLGMTSSPVGSNVKWRPRSLLSAILGIVVLLPISYQWGESEIFYIQIMVFLLAFVVCFHRKRFLVITGLDRQVLYYVVWILASFVVNSIASTIAGQDELNQHRFLSLCVFGIVFLLPYVVGRRYFKSVRDFEWFFRFMLLSSFGVMIYYLWAFAQFGFGDLYASREVMFQRIPMVIGFSSALAFFYGIGSRPPRLYPLMVFVLGTTLVGLSFTRAVYMQVLASTLAAIIVVKRYHVVRGIAIVAVILFVLIAAAVPSAWEGMGAIAGRMRTASNAFVSVVQSGDDVESVGPDESSSLRLLIWRELFQRILDNPLRLLTGFGQLGPSYIGGELVSNAGAAVSKYSAHSDYIDVLVRAGLVGSWLLLTVWWTVVRHGFRLWSHDRASNILFAAHSVALFGVAVCSFFHESTRYPLFGMYFWFYAGFVSSHIDEKKREREVLTVRHS